MADGLEREGVWEGKFEYGGGGGESLDQILVASPKLQYQYGYPVIQIRIMLILTRF